MPQVKFSVDHNLTEDQAKIRVQDMLTKAGFLGEFNDLEWNWEYPEKATIHFNFKGVDYTGELIILDKVVEVTGEVSWMAYVFRSQIEAEIRRRLIEALTTSLSRN